jgi:hypothetical protein
VVRVLDRRGQSATTLAVKRRAVRCHARGDDWLPQDHRGRIDCAIVSEREVDRYTRIRAVWHYYYNYIMVTYGVSEVCQSRKAVKAFLPSRVTHMTMGHASPEASFSWFRVSKIRFPGDRLVVGRGVCLISYLVYSRVILQVRMNRVM